MQVNNPTEISKYYKALVERDPGFIGIFFVGVKTTGVFCISTCRARKPKPENVEFFTELKEALKFGYRPCKICQPTTTSSQIPEDISGAMEFLKKQPDQKISDYHLLKSGIRPEKVRRWFKQHYGITFQSYQRMIRINNAYNELRQGINNVTSSAFDSGYESLSGFGYSFKKIMGNTPSGSKAITVVLVNRFTTPLGPMYACSTPEGICLLEFTDRRMLETEFEDLQKRLKAKIIIGENEHLNQLKRELQEYFDGKRQIFEVKLATPGSDFQQAAWKALQKIPYGHTVSYQQQSMALNVPNAVRAIASANGQNRISILIPCHRVIGKDGNLTGYGGGLDRKKWLLEHERYFLNNSVSFEGE